MQPALALLAIISAGLVLAGVRASSPLADYEPSYEDTYNRGVEQLIYGIPHKRESCVPRGGNCDHSPSSCCEGTKCRCNLWGANCSCKRKGLFSA